VFNLKIKTTARMGTFPTTFILQNVKIQTKETFVLKKGVEGNQTTHSSGTNVQLFFSSEKAK
jgi:hypothetical protein